MLISLYSRQGYKVEVKSKHIDSLEDMGDGIGPFEGEGNASSGKYDDGAESALAWRRSMIEKASLNVKAAKERGINYQEVYRSGLLVYEESSNKFGRVLRSIPGYLQIEYLSGGQKEYGTFDIENYLKNYTGKQSCAEIASALGVKTEDVISKLEALESKQKKTKVRIKKQSTALKEEIDHSRIDSLLV